MEGKNALGRKKCCCNTNIINKSSSVSKDPHPLVIKPDWPVGFFQACLMTPQGTFPLYHGSLFYYPQVFSQLLSQQYPIWYPQDYAIHIWCHHLKVQSNTINIYKSPKITHKFPKITRNPNHLPSFSCQSIRIPGWSPGPERLSTHLWRLAGSWYGDSGEMKQRRRKKPDEMVVSMLV